MNKSPKPAAEVVGMLSAVLFSAEDIALVHGSPAGRRRFLDVLLSQMSRDYLRTLQGYQKVLAQTEPPAPTHRGRPLPPG